MLFAPLQTTQTPKNDTKHGTQNSKEIQLESLQDLSSNTLKQNAINANLVKRLLYDEKNIEKTIIEKTQEILVKGCTT